MAGRLLHSLRTLRSAVGATLAIALPGYGMRGLSGMAGLQGGYEEVYDFRHREIGYFRWGLIDVGPSVTGLGIGSYTSIGWKGYKVNWTLQDAYQTGICKSEPRFAPSITLGPAWSAGLGLSYCTDADNSGSVWLPEPHGVNGVVFSNGISANLVSWVPGLARANSYLNALGADYQMAKYWMFTSECFDTLGQFLRGMYKVHCASCRGFREHARLGALRTITHLFGFPLATEMLHTFIAWQYDRHVVPDGYERPCSDLSTRNRREPENVLRAVSRELQRSTELLDQIEVKVQEVQSELVAAVENNPELTESSEWQQLTSAHHFCARHPMLPQTLEGAAKEEDAELTEDVREQLRNRTRDELITACRRFRRIRRCSWRSKESLVDALAERATVAADEEEPFGLCDRDSDCPLPNQECGRVNGVRHCVCRDETCHRLNASGADSCSEEQQGRGAVEHVTSEMRAFVLSHRIDVGEYILAVQRLTSGV